ncbi:Nuclear transport factor 2 [Apiotrichum porosum]|uniref:NTF2-related export protein n=1 Tax=Apiotrichum porosum TaxID=105984 RepID=A0A427Y0K1_9TREE|nr:Nuclear transport factor 2 [Apiotrichum porosum]RSH84617.1 Nuclear transport factor 2 [Apiotrichum porosum]
MADINTIAQQFTDYYYSTFDADRAGLAPLYRDHSMLTWEENQIQGTAAIMEKLQASVSVVGPSRLGLPFTRVVHKVVTRDAQPGSSTVASILVLVTGQLIVDDGSNILQFSQMFHLVPDGGSYFVQNDVFRLVYG